MNDWELQQEKDYAWLLMVGEIDTIRKKSGAYIWGFPIKWREDGGRGEVTKERFGWEIEFENGWCINVGYSSRDFETYQLALEDAIAFFNSNPTGDREITPKQD